MSVTKPRCRRIGLIKRLGEYAMSVCQPGAFERSTVMMTDTGTRLLD
jgi:hypothetical protein